MRRSKLIAKIFDFSFISDITVFILYKVTNILRNGLIFGWDREVQRNSKMTEPVRNLFIKTTILQIDLKRWSKNRNFDHCYVDLGMQD